MFRLPVTTTKTRRGKSPAFLGALVVKQWGGTNRKAAGRLLDGRTWDEFRLNDQKGSKRTAGGGVGAHL
jgi:hypothetical protein